MLRSSDQDQAPAAPGPGVSPRGIWNVGRCAAGAGDARLVDQHSLCGAPQSRPPAARGSGGAMSQHVVQTHSRITPATDALPGVSQFGVAACQFALGFAPARAY